MAGAGRMIARAKAYIVMANAVMAHILMAHIVMAGPRGWAGHQRGEVGRQAVRQGGRLATFPGFINTAVSTHLYEYPRKCQGYINTLPRKYKGYTNTPVSVKAI